MKTDELRKMQLSALKEATDLKKGEIAKIGLDPGSGKSEGNVRLKRKHKRDLARILTIIKEKESHEK